MKRKNNWHVKFGLKYRNKESPLDGTEIMIDFGSENEIEDSNDYFLGDDSGSRYIEEDSDDE